MNTNMQDYQQIYDKIKIADSVKKDTLVKIKEANSKKKLTFKKRMIIVFAAVVVLISSVMTVFAVNSDNVAPDDMAFLATYIGNGIVSIRVYNGTSKDITFEKQYRFNRWETGEVQKKTNGEYQIDKLKCKKGSYTVIQINLSNMYDIEKLENEVIEDYYYITLTDNRFIHGRDWNCSFRFNDLKPSDSQSESNQIHENYCNPKAKIEKKLEDYYLNDGDSTSFLKNYNELEQKLDGKVIYSKWPRKLVVNAPENIVWDKDEPLETQYLLWGENCINSNELGKVITSPRRGSFDTTVLQIQSMGKMKDPTCYVGIPLFYLICLDKKDIMSYNEYVFVYGSFYKIHELENIKVYEDDQYVVYNISNMIYSDVDKYINDVVNTNIKKEYRDQSIVRTKNVYSYFTKHLKDSFRYLD